MAWRGVNQANNPKYQQNLELCSQPILNKLQEGKGKQLGFRQIPSSSIDQDTHQKRGNMSYKVEKVRDKPIIIFTIEQGFKFEKSTEDVQQEIASIVEGLTKPIFLITDFSRIDMTFSELVLALGNARSGVAGSFSDQRLRNVFVGHDDMVDLAAKSLFQTQYGKIPVLVFTTLDEAIAYAEGMLD